MPQDADIEMISSRHIYRNRWMRVREDEVRRRDGSTGIYGVIEKPSFVVVAPMEADGSLHLVQQYRYPVAARFWEFPQGAWEQQPDADLLDVAIGELREETGLTAATMTFAGKLYQGYGYSTQPYHVYLATGLQPGEAKREHEEQDLITRTFALADVEAMIRTTEIKDASTVAAFGLLRLLGLL